MQWGGPGILGFSHPDPWVGMHKHNPCMHHKQQPHAGTPSTTWILRVRMIWHFPLSQSFFRSHVRTNSIKSSWQHSFVKWLHFSSFFNMAGYNKPPFAGVQKTSWISVASYSWLIQIDLQYTCHLLSMEIGCNTVTQSKPSLDNVWIGPCLSTGKPVDSEGEEGSLHKNCIDSLHTLFPGFWQSPNDQCINIQHIFGGWNRSDLKHWEFWNSKQFLHSKSWMEHSILVTNHGLAVPRFERKHQVLPIQRWLNAKKNNNPFYWHHMASCSHIARIHQLLRH